MTGQTTIEQTQRQEVAVMRPDQVDDHLRAIEAANLRRDGLQWQEIASELDYHDASSAYRAVNRLLRRESAESASEYRTLMLERYEALWRAAWARVKTSDADPAAVTAAVRVADRLVALTGADQPIVDGQVVQRTNQELDAEIAELVNQQREIGRQDALRELTTTFEETM